MLDVLLHEDIHNTVVVVTRYFGGVLLGTGGLVRAYQKATQSGLESSIIIEKQRGILGSIVTDYNGIGKFNIFWHRTIFRLQTAFMEKMSAFRWSFRHNSRKKIEKRTDRGYEWKSRDRLGKRGHFCNC